MLTLVFQFSKSAKSYVFVYLVISSHTNNTFMPALNVEIMFAVYILTQMSHQTCGFQDASSPSVHLTISTFQRQTPVWLGSEDLWGGEDGIWDVYSSLNMMIIIIINITNHYYHHHHHHRLHIHPTHHCFHHRFDGHHNPIAIFIHDASLLPPLAFLSASWWWIVLFFLLFFFTMWYVVSHCSYWVKVGKTIDCPMYVYWSIFFHFRYRHIKYACISILFYHKMLQGAERLAPYCTPLAVVGSVGCLPEFLGDFLFQTVWEGSHNQINLADRNHNLINLFSEDACIDACASLEGRSF